MPGYTIKVDETRPHALGRDLDISPKHAVEICREIRGKPVDDAIDYLERVEEKKQAVAFKRYNKQVASKKGVGPGRYPVKAAEHILKLLQGAEANAEFKGLDTENLRVIHASACSGMKLRNFMERAQGRSTPKNEYLAHVELVLEQTEKPAAEEE